MTDKFYSGICAFSARGFALPAFLVKFIPAQSVDLAVKRAFAVTLKIWRQPDTRARHKLAYFRYYFGRYRPSQTTNHSLFH